MLMVHPSNHLRDIARSLFTRVSADLPPVGDERLWLRLPENCDPSLLTQWFQYAGASLTELTLGYCFENADTEAVEEMLEALEANCVSIRRLDISGLSHDQLGLARGILKNVSGRLHRLVMRDPGISSAALHCTGLRDLVVFETKKFRRCIARCRSDAAID